MRLRIHGNRALTVDPYSDIERAFAAEQTSARLAALSPEQRSRLHAYWVDRAEGELTTALTFEYMLDDLRQENAPAELLTMAQGALEDEHRHVDWCLRWARAVDSERPADAKLGGTRALAFDGASPRDNRLLRTVFGCCFSETVAVHVLRSSHALITLDSVRRLNLEHMKEEVPHARLGWALLGWSGVTSRDRQMIHEHVSEMTWITRMVWQTTRREADDDLHALGYLSSAIIDEACEEALRDVVIPGLRHLGVGANE
jgi:hypothetical protein